MQVIDGDEEPRGAETSPEDPVTPKFARRAWRNYESKYDASHIIPAAVDLDLFTCIRVLCVMWIRSLAIRVRVLFSYFSLSFDVSGGAIGYNFQ